MNVNEFIPQINYVSGMQINYNINDTLKFTTVEIYQEQPNPLYKTIDLKDFTYNNPPAPIQCNGRVCIKKLSQTSFIVYYNITSMLICDYYCEQLPGTPADHMKMYFIISGNRIRVGTLTIQKGVTTFYDVNFLNLQNNFNPFIDPPMSFYTFGYLTFPWPQNIPLGIENTKASFNAVLLENNAGEGIYIRFRDFTPRDDRFLSENTNHGFLICREKDKEGHYYYNNFHFEFNTNKTIEFDWAVYFEGPLIKNKIQLPITKATLCCVTLDTLQSQGSRIQFENEITLNSCKLMDLPPSPNHDHP